jgi:hypothetical protein
MARTLGWMALLSVLCWPGAAWATTARGLGLREHLHGSDVVVEGRVAQQTIAHADGYTFVDSTIVIARTLHGRARGRIVVRQLGPDRVVVGDGRLAVGERVVVFVRRAPHDRFYLTALAQSVYHVRGSGDRAQVVRQLDELSLVRQDPSGRFVPATLDTPATIAELRRAIAEAR